jgi:UDP-3-O-[3-hydroxymyristoyl] N-acetylglucosamine deacetylase/3-hydroxyacyl-[acyl-carrier-protein] dehydratase
MSSEPQQTLARTASVSGTSLHTGEKVTLKLQPAPVDFGLNFRRKDLQDEPTIDATIREFENGSNAPRRSGKDRSGCTPSSTCSRRSPRWASTTRSSRWTPTKPPIGDGSARPYVELNQESRSRRAGNAAPDFRCPREPIYVETKNGSLMVLLPDPKFRISCTQAGRMANSPSFFHGNHPRSL